MNLQVLILALSFICPSPVTPLMASVCQLPSRFTLCSASRANLATVTEKTEKSADVVCQAIALLDFLSIIW